MGFDVELIPKSDKKGIRTPDIIMDNLKWEMKSPKGKGRWLLENTLQIMKTKKIVEFKK